MCRIALSLNLYYAALNYASATFATALTNTIPATVFVIAVSLRSYNLQSSTSFSILDQLSFLWCNSATSRTNFSTCLKSCYRIEKLAISQWHGRAKVFGTIVGLSGAMAFTFFKGPPLRSSGSDKNQEVPAKTYTREEWIIGSILLLAANVTWSMWLIMQVIVSYYVRIVN